MDECYVVELREKYQDPIPVVDTGYETVGIVHLYPSEYLPQPSQVITVTPTPKQNKLHPLEIEVQKSQEARRQNEIARLSNNSVIQALPTTTRSIASNSAIQRLDAAVISASNVNSEFSRILPQGSEANVYASNPSKIVWESTTPFSVGETESSASIQTYEPLEVDSSQIPLTVQYCTQTTDQPSTTEEAEESVSDEARSPVLDDEPDPKSSDPPPSNESNLENKCYMCFKKFRQKKNMYAHIRKIHSTQPKIQGGIICPLCMMYSLRQDHLRCHLETLHGIEILKEERQFQTVTEFNDWKDYVEKETFSYFISKSSTKLLAFNQTKTYYKCHRSGKSEAKKKNPKKNSYKIGATCPAAMEVIENVKGITVTFWATHVGHNLLSKNDSTGIRGLLSTGLSWDQALDEMQQRQELQGPSPPNDSAAQIKYVVMDKKIISLGRKPKPCRLTRSASQSLLIEKAERFLSILESTEVMAAFRPIISTMIDNITSIVKRRAVGNVREKSKTNKRRKAGVPLDTLTFSSDEQADSPVSIDDSLSKTKGMHKRKISDPELAKKKSMRLRSAR